VTSRLLSTPHPDAWNVAAEVVAAAAKLAAPGTPPAYAAYLDRLVGELLNLACAACEKKTYNPMGPVADHMAIFLRSGAPGVLAQLYLSPDAACRAAADSAIRRFLMPDLLTEHGKIKAWTAPVLLEFSRPPKHAPDRDLQRCVEPRVLARLAARTARRAADPVRRREGGRRHGTHRGRVPDAGGG
jgi:hypothetical protein